MTPSEVPPELARALLCDAPAIATEPDPSRRLCMAAETVARIMSRYEEAVMDMICDRNRRFYSAAS